MVSFEGAPMADSETALVALPSDLRDRLDAVAVRLGLPLAEIVRHAIEDYLSGQEALAALDLALEDDHDHLHVAVILDSDAP